MQYEVEPGDDLSSIGERFDLPVQRLVAANHRHMKGMKTSGEVFPGQVLCIPSWATYVAQGGETVGDIAQRFGTTEAALVAANGDIQSPTDTVAPRQTLAVPYRDTYTVSPGDTLSQLGSRFGIPWDTLFEANCDVLAYPNLIYPGQTLAVPANSGMS
jgi:LysM repeat protein